MPQPGPPNTFQDAKFFEPANRTNDGTSMFADRFGNLAVTHLHHIRTVGMPEHVSEHHSVDGLDSIGDTVVKSVQYLEAIALGLASFGRR